MMEFSSLPILPASKPQAKCDGGCQGCGKAHIKLLGYHDEANMMLRKNVEEALIALPMAHKLIEVYEPNAIAAAGVTALPALVLDGQIMVQGRVPTPAEIVEIFRDRPLQHSKLHRLRTIAVAVDISKGADSALRFAWHVAQKVGASLEVVYVMDSIFDGHLASGSGFLSSYQHTMQAELDDFIRETMAQIGVKYEAPAPGAPGQPQSPASPALRSKLVYGFPDATLEECSRQVDLLVLGTSGQGTLGKKMFGSVSTEVSQRAHCPVLLVPPDAEFRGLQNVLYASNFDSLDTLRIQQAASFTRHFDGQIHFVHVGRDGEEGVGLAKKLFDFGYRASRPDQPFLFCEITGNDVMQGLYEYSLYQRIELMVFVTHQRSFWENMLHHSITREAVASTDQLPMLIVHSDDDMLR